MSRTSRTRPTAALAGALIGAVVLAGCGAGQESQTANQVTAVGGANSEVGDIAVRDAGIEFPDEVEGADVYERGGSAPLRMSIVNVGGQLDRLVSATSPAASEVVITGEDRIPGGRVLLVGGEPASPEPTSAAPTAAAPTAAGAPTTAAAPSSDADADATDAASTSPPAVGNTESPATALSTADASASSTPSADGEGIEPGTVTSVVLSGLREEIRAGLTYEVVLTFERSGDLRLDVPVANPSAPREDEPEE